MIGAKVAYDRVMRLAAVNSPLLKMEWDSIDEQTGGVLSKVFGSHDNYKVKSNSVIYNQGSLEMLLTKWPVSPRPAKAVNLAFDDSSDWGKTEKSRLGF